MGAHWFKFYAQDFLRDSKVMLLDDASIGVLVKLWCLCCMDGGFPSGPKALGKLLSKRPDHAHQALIKVSSFFVDDPLMPGIKVSSRLLAQQAAYACKVIANQTNGPKGGRPKKNPLGLHVEPTHGNPTITEPELEPEPEKDIPLTPRGKKIKTPKVETIGDYPPELISALDVWRDLFAYVKHEDTREKFPKDKIFLPTSGVGTRGTTHKAWVKRTSARCQGEKITNEDVLQAVKFWASRKMALADAGGDWLGIKALAAMINHEDFEDAIEMAVRMRTEVKEPTNVA